MMRSIRSSGTARGPFPTYIQNDLKTLTTKLCVAVIPLWVGSIPTCFHQNNDIKGLKPFFLFAAWTTIHMKSISLFGMNEYNHRKLGLLKNKHYYMQVIKGEGNNNWCR